MVNTGSFISFASPLHGTSELLSFLFGKCEGLVVLKLETVTLVVDEEAF